MSQSSYFNNEEEIIVFGTIGGSILQYKPNKKEN